MVIETLDVKSKILLTGELDLDSKLQNARSRWGFGDIIPFDKGRKLVAAYRACQRTYEFDGKWYVRDANGNFVPITLNFIDRRLFSTDTTSIALGRLSMRTLHFLSRVQERSAPIIVTEEEAYPSNVDTLMKEDTERRAKNGWLPTHFEQQAREYEERVLNNILRISRVGLKQLISVD